MLKSLSPGYNGGDNVSKYTDDRASINIFSKRATGFHRWAKPSKLNFSIGKNFPVNGQTRQAKFTACRFS